jgi:gamma-glutamyltranspeptidase/glutathione hydrolase
MFTTRPDLLGTHGMVASTHWLASAAGMAMLERGGNAFDAACAAGFVLQVVEPHMNGPGGEVPILLYDAEKQITRVVCGQGPAPRAATVERFKALGLDLVPGSGLLAAVVPGAFDAWLVMLKEHGRLRLSEVMEPAIAYAEKGYPLAPRVAQSIAAAAPIFQDQWPTSAAVYLPHGRPPEAGRLFRNPVLADTLKRLLAESGGTSVDRDDKIEAARRVWYQGFVAEAIDKFCRVQEPMDGSGRPHGGLLTGDDLVDWEATFERPVTYDYHGRLVCKPGPWSQGPVLLQQLALLRDIDLAAMDPMGEEFVHVVVEAAKLALADREAYYGDPAFAKVPLDRLLGDPYNAERRGLIGDRASRELRPGAVDGIAPRLPDPDSLHADLDDAGIADPAWLGAATGDTCYLAVADRFGNVVSATPSGGWLQSSPVIPELGFCLSTRAQMFWLEPDMPSALGPGRRPRTTLSPTLVLRDAGASMAFGTPGGDQQDQWPLIAFLRHVHHGMSLQQAIDAPVFHTAHAPSSFFPRRAAPGSLHVESRFAEATLERLEARGHEVVREEPWSLGRTCAVAREEQDEGAVLKAAANARWMQGYAVGR